MTPIVLALLVATGWLLAAGGATDPTQSPPWRLWLLSVATMLLVWRTRLHLLWLLGAGALLGALGWI